MIGLTLRRDALPALVLVLALLGAGGCGEDEETGGTPAVFDVRNGTWATVTTLWATGADSCQEAPFDLADTLVACTFDPIGIDDPNLPSNFRCDVARNGDEVTISCSGSQTLACTKAVIVEGSGRVSETDVDFTLSFVERFSGPEPCPVYVSPCTLWAGFTGEWISSEGDSLCEEGSAAPAGLAVAATFPLAFEASR